MDEVKIWEQPKMVLRQSVFGFFMLLVSVGIFYGGLRGGEYIYIVGGVLGFVLFGASFVSVVRRLLVRQPLLTVSGEGITDTSTLTSIGFMSWDEIESVTMAKRMRQTFVDIAMRNDDKVFERLPVFKRYLLKLNFESKHGLVSIPLGTAEMPVDAVRELLEARLKEHGRMLIYN